MQRIKRFTAFESTCRSDCEPLVSEFLDVSTATVHEFTNDLGRQRYARYIHAVG
ncbi:hypothetical protein [Microvirga roseola]|uniref:hypothetical protein n=1 Tax=Microvirga roseola TaxID=2883126 RepID=UPI001E5AB290|nr:hypothetical protein [Microvirga roseola]